MCIVDVLNYKPCFLCIERILTALNFLTLIFVNPLTTIGTPVNHLPVFFSLKIKLNDFLKE